MAVTRDVLASALAEPPAPLAQSPQPEAPAPAEPPASLAQSPRPEAPASAEPAAPAQGAQPAPADGWPAAWLKAVRVPTGAARAGSVLAPCEGGA
ncbi:unnamed protein product [Prorocentrum cordatum]|uniref:Uncharacterized protein n=1 Tax=Prorocentrum cordatum TaxID=2364126 RepID=A0ABN9QZK8_9DINO|nr:unnamed protein product [Polarella glacialis]